MLLFAFVTGLVIAGFTGTFLELAGGKPIGLGEPFVSHRRIARSLLFTLLAGPFMLTGEARMALTEGRIDRLAFGCCLIASALWVLASGIIILSAANHATGLFI